MGTAFRTVRGLSLTVPWAGDLLPKRLVIYCQTTGVSAAHATHCATYCTPCRPLIRAFSGWIRTPPPTGVSYQHYQALAKAMGLPLNGQPGTRVWDGEGAVPDRSLGSRPPPRYKVDIRLPGKGNSKLPWRKAGPPNHLDDKVDSDQ